VEPASAQEHEPRFRWQSLDVAVFVVFFVGTVFILPSIAYLVLQFLQPGLEITDLSGVQLILIQAVMNLAWVGFIFFLISKVHHQPILRTLRMLPTNNLAVIRMLGTGALLAIVALVATSFFPAPTDTPLQQLLSTTPSIVLFVTFGIFVAPVLEEIVFRGFVFTALVDLCGSKAALLITTASFAALHFFQIGGSWPAVIVILFISYVFTAVRQRRDSTLASAILHTAYNATIFAASVVASILGMTAS